MTERVGALAAFLIETERLKLVERTAYVSDHSRRENSAEHSWHLALGLAAIACELQVPIDMEKALLMAVVHDLSEIDAGDLSAYVTDRTQQDLAEKACMDRLSRLLPSFGPRARELWEEYEAQASLEARWVRVLDRLMPFVVNLACGGKTWKERGLSRSQVIAINEPVRIHAPEIFAWMVPKIDECTAKGWLREA